MSSGIVSQKFQEYNPSTPSDWVVLPNTNSAGLDELAARKLNQSEARYVDQNGSDLTGNGQLDRPWATFAHALASITDASSTKRYTIYCQGEYDNQTINLKPWISICGSTRLATKITLTANLGIDPSFSAGGQVTLICLSIGGAFADLNLDLKTNGSAVNKGVIELVNFSCSGQAIWKAASGNDVFESWDSLFFNGLAGSGGQNYHQGLYSSGSIICDNGTLADNEYFQYEFANLYLPTGGGNFSLTLPNTKTNTNILTMSGIVADLLTVNAPASLSFYATDSIIRNNSVISGGVTIHRLSDAKGINYVPTVPGNWATAPSTVKAALDALAGATSTPATNPGSFTFTYAAITAYEYTPSLGANTFTVSNIAEGESVCLSLVSPGAYTILWAGVNYWGGAAAPTPTATVGRRDIYTFIKVNGNVIGNAVLNCG